MAATELTFEQQMTERLNRLERQLSYWRRGAIAALALAAVAVAGAMAEPPQDLSVRTLRVVDTTGKDRIVLSSNPEEADITLFDPSGKSRLTLDVAKDRRPVLFFADETGTESNRLVLGLEDEGHPALMLYDSKGRKRVAFGIPKEGGPVIRVLDESGKLRMRFP